MKNIELKTSAPDFVLIRPRNHDFPFTNEEMDQEPKLQMLRQ